MKYIFFVFLSLIYAADNNAPSNRTRDRQIDVEHIKINVSIDLKNQSVYGHVVHTLSPLQSQLESFSLDAEDMVIRRVRVGDQDVEFDHFGGKVYISLPRSIGWYDTIDVRLDYNAKPRLGTFFFKPDETYPGMFHQA